MNSVKVHQSFRYELKPNNKQIGLLIKHCGIARFAWNWGLAYRKIIYKTHEGKERFTNAMKQYRELIILKRTEFPWMYEVSKCAPQEALRDLDRAYANFYRGLKKHEDIGKPKFKKKGIHDSFRLRKCIHVFKNTIKLPRIGIIRTKENTVKFKGRILSATISREVDRWFCSLCVEAERQEPQPIIGDIIGVDLGLNSFAVISNGEGYVHKEAPKPLKKYLLKLLSLLIKNKVVFIHETG